ncbi:hypothetical protein QW71_09795 [Paenibacillus sp. IHB B 3415]|uniref:hypothetical protein n=1 Tax=Paenibacillus sp. IHB B 3415 TaxID=867080 RepID=UPI000573E492|nr:hypothetical protein [Paenibacillus sp. IHB B 3415]KHL95891.1 hypothetical protein QW71_09795 [Paenibacillus sp. IHB B 3415]
MEIIDNEFTLEHYRQVIEENKQLHDTLSNRNQGMYAQNIKIHDLTEAISIITKALNEEKSSHGKGLRTLGHMFKTLSPQIHETMIIDTESKI